VAVWREREKAGKKRSAVSLSFEANATTLAARR
jgi:hypothetical protein